jgi:hypothetical protein
MAATSTAGRTCSRFQRPQVNLFDIPELMPGARSSASPAERLDFEQRCIHLHMTDEEKVVHPTRAAAPMTAGHVTIQDLEDMFPALDSALVRALAADAGTPQQAMETLLALAAAVAEPVEVAQPEAELGLQDMDAFPSLMDADGWQVSSQHMFHCDVEESLGSAWCDRAKAIAKSPAPVLSGPVKSIGGCVKKRVCKQEPSMRPERPETDYEFRQSLGRRRVQNRARFPGNRRGSPLATGAESTLVEASQEDNESLSTEDSTGEES